MNILFLTKSFGIGGVEVVTMTLAKAFVKHGHQVIYFLSTEPTKYLRNNYLRIFRFL